jgi:hypothetical protein
MLYSRQWWEMDRWPWARLGPIVTYMKECYSYVVVPQPKKPAENEDK